MQMLELGESELADPGWCFLLLQKGFCHGFGETSLL